MLATLVLSIVVFAQVGVGDLQVTCPAGARVYLDGTFAGLCTQQEDGKYFSQIASGSHTVRVEKQGFVPSSRTVNVPRGGVVEVRFDQLVPDVSATPNRNTTSGALNAEVGSLIVRCAPVTCRFTILGKTYENGAGTTSQTVSNIPTGTHRLEARRGSQVLAGQVSVEIDVQREIKADFLSGALVDLTADREAEEAERQTQAALARRPISFEVIGSGADLHTWRASGKGGSTRYLSVEVLQGENPNPSSHRGFKSYSSQAFPVLASAFCYESCKTWARTGDIRPRSFFVVVECVERGSDRSNRESAARSIFSYAVSSATYRGQAGTKYIVRGAFTGSVEGGCHFSVDEVRERVER